MFQNAWAAIYPDESLTSFNNLLEIHLLQVYSAISASIFIYLQSYYGLVPFINLEYLCLIENILKTKSRSILKRNINAGNAVLKVNNVKTGLIIEFG